MCGIVGYIGKCSAVKVLENGLTKLEYRGYDSAGVAVINGQGVKMRRAVGKLDVLKKSLHDEPIHGHIGIAHTRWATHGEPNETNSHPHRDSTETVWVCHNGIIENYSELRQELQAEGVTFRSQTDSEVLPNLIKLAYDKISDKSGAARLGEAVRQACARVRGTYAIAVLHRDLPETLVGVRWKSPLVVGLGEDENVLASDIPAVLQITRRVILLDDGEMAIINRDSVEVFDMDDWQRAPQSRGPHRLGRSSSGKRRFSSLHAEGNS
jgi:glucosamine--fructose-6-phosphate aminotransferase (isomerizing)